jgi:hypothetical protein
MSSNVLIVFQLILYEEIMPNMVCHIEDQNLPLKNAVDEPMNGDILVFQKHPVRAEDFRLPTIPSYFSYLFYKVQKHLLT